MSALDVSIRSQVLDLVERLQAKHDLSYVVISHDLAVVEHLSGRIGVMYLGMLVEAGPSARIHASPAHHCTAGLVDAIPVPEPGAERAERTAGVRGELPSPVDPPSGCRLRTRCPAAQDLCAEVVPPMRRSGPDRCAGGVHLPVRGDRVRIR